MKKLKYFLFLLIIIPCAFILNACAMPDVKTSVYVTDIKQTSTLGETTTYTVYYSNGTTSLFTVENGKDGENGESLTIESIKQYCEANNENFEEFLAKYLTIVQENKSVQTATNIAIHSAVSVWCEFPYVEYYEKQIVVGCGAGVIYEMHETYSYIITNFHVVYSQDCETENNYAKKVHIFQYGSNEAYYKTGKTDEDKFPILSYGEGAVEAEIIGGSMNHDIAVLKVKTSDLLANNPNAKGVSIAPSYNIAETAIAIGNPESDGISVTSGIVSVVSEEFTMKGADEKTNCTFRVLRMDTSVNSGNSGGGLFNINGELIGIVNVKVVSSNVDNIAYALPCDNVTKVADNLIYYHEQNNEISKVKTLVLDSIFTIDNIRAVYNPSTKQTNLVEDVVVNSVNLKSSINNNYGLGYLIGLQTGDKIKSIKINGSIYQISRFYEFSDLLLTIRTGDKIAIIVERNHITSELGLTSNEGIGEEYLKTIV